MSMPVVVQLVEDTIHNVFGSMYLGAIVIMFLLLIGFLFCNIDFKFALLLISPLPIVFSNIGWFPGWVGGVFWVIVVTFGGLVIWNTLKREY